MGILSILGLGNNVKEALRKGGIIIDVRTAHEFDAGKAKGSINIPVDRISINLERIRSMRKPIIICGYSHSENDKAIAILRTAGITQVHNAGNWAKLLRTLKSL